MFVGFYDVRMGDIVFCPLSFVLCQRKKPMTVGAVQECLLLTNDQ